MGATASGKFFCFISYLLISSRINFFVCYLLNRLHVRSIPNLFLESVTCVCDVLVFSVIRWYTFLFLITLHVWDNILFILFCVYHVNRLLCRHLLSDRKFTWSLPTSCFLFCCFPYTSHNHWFGDVNQFKCGPSLSCFCWFNPYAVVVFHQCITYFHIYCLLQNVVDPNVW